MKVLHVTPGFYPAHFYGGPIQSTYDLCRHLAQQGCDVRVLTTNTNGPQLLDVPTDREVQSPAGFRIRYTHRWRREATAPQLLALLPAAVGWADVVHLTGTYSFSTIPGLLAAKLGRKPLVWSPRGALQRWAGTRRSSAKAAWEKVCCLAAPRRMVLHVTSQEEADQSCQRIPGFRAAIIPNGVAPPERPVPRVPRQNGFRLAFLGRLAEIKGIEQLIGAAAELIDTPNWRLSIAGTGDPTYIRHLTNLIDQHNLSARVRLVGEVTGDSKEQFFANSDLLILPSHSENFGMVVAEALVRGCPVIASTGTPWRDLENVGCGRWVANAPPVLAAAIRGLMSGENLEQLGERGRQWITREFGWTAVSEKMVALYRELSS